MNSINKYGKLFFYKKLIFNFYKIQTKASVAIRLLKKYTTRHLHPVDVIIYLQ